MDQGDGVREAEFVLAILEHNGTLNKERDVDPWKKKFQEMQPDRDRLYKEVDIIIVSKIVDLKYLCFALPIVVIRFFLSRVCFCKRSNYSRWWQY